MTMAIAYGGDPGSWLEDPRALITAVEVAEEMAREMERRR